MANRIWDLSLLRKSLPREAQDRVIYAEPVYLATDASAPPSAAKLVCAFVESTALWLLPASSASRPHDERVSLHTSLSAISLLECEAQPSRVVFKDCAEASVRRITLRYEQGFGRPSLTPSRRTTISSQQSSTVVIFAFSFGSRLYAEVVHARRAFRVRTLLRCAASLPPPTGGWATPSAASDALDRLARALSFVEGDSRSLPALLGGSSGAARPRLAERTEASGGSGELAGDCDCVGGTACVCGAVGAAARAHAAVLRRASSQLAPLCQALLVAVAVGGEGEGASEAGAAQLKRALFSHPALKALLGAAEAVTVQLRVTGLALSGSATHDDASSSSRVYVASAGPPSYPSGLGGGEGAGPTPSRRQLSSPPASPPLHRREAMSPPLQSPATPASPLRQWAAASSPLRSPSTPSRSPGARSGSSGFPSTAAASPVRRRVPARLREQTVAGLQVARLAFLRAAWGALLAAMFDSRGLAERTSLASGAASGVSVTALVAALLAPFEDDSVAAADDAADAAAAGGTVPAEASDAEPVPPLTVATAAALASHVAALRDVCASLLVELDDCLAAAAEHVGAAEGSDAARCVRRGQDSTVDTQAQWHANFRRGLPTRGLLASQGGAQSPDYGGVAGVCVAVGGRGVGSLVRWLSGELRGMLLTARLAKAAWATREAEKRRRAPPAPALDVPPAATEEVPLLHAPAQDEHELLSAPYPDAFHDDDAGLLLLLSAAPLSMPPPPFLLESAAAASPSSTFWLLDVACSARPFGLRLRGTVVDSVHPGGHCAGAVLPGDELVAVGGEYVWAAAVERHADIGAALAEAAADVSLGHPFTLTFLRRCEAADPPVPPEPPPHVRWSVRPAPGVSAGGVVPAVLLVEAEFRAQPLGVRLDGGCRVAAVSPGGLADGILQCGDEVVAVALQGAAVWASGTSREEGGAVVAAAAAEEGAVAALHAAIAAAAGRADLGSPLTLTLLRPLQQGDSSSSSRPPAPPPPLRPVVRLRHVSEDGVIEAALGLRRAGPVPRSSADDAPDTAAAATAAYRSGAFPIRLLTLARLLAALQAHGGEPGSTGAAIGPADVGVAWLDGAHPGLVLHAASCPLLAEATKVLERLRADALRRRLHRESASGVG